MSAIGNSYYTEGMRYLKQNSIVRAIGSFHKAVEEGHGAAAAKLGQLHETGRGTEKNIEKAIELYEKGISYESPEAKGLLGDLYYRGLAGEEKKDEGIILLKEAAKTYDPDTLVKVFRYVGKKEIPVSKEELDFYINRADRMLRHGQINEIDYLRLIYLENDEKTDDQLMQFDKMFFDLSHFEEAEEIFREIVLKNPASEGKGYEEKLKNKIGYVTAGKRAEYWLSLIEEK